MIRTIMDRKVAAIGRIIAEREQAQKENARMKKALEEIMAEYPNPQSGLSKALQEFCLYVCLKCKHEWVSRLPIEQTPKQCPRCKNSRWQQGPKIKGMGRPKKS